MINVAAGRLGHLAKKDWGLGNWWHVARREASR